MEHRIVVWLIHYGPIVLFFAQVFGIVGLPIPDEFLLTVAGSLIRRGALNGPTTLAAAIAGCASGITISYALGRTVGLPTLRRVLRLHPKSVDRAERWFHRFGRWLIAFGYFIPGVRHVTAIAAGSVPLSYREFAAYAYSGAVLWCCLFIGAGYYAGDRWQHATDLLRDHLRVVALLLVAAAALWVALKRRRVSA
jgi:membrane protein DedA with SNARE-associated domain